MASKANKDLLKHLKSKPKPELGSIEYDLMLQSNLSVNNPIRQDSPTIIILCGPSGSGKSTIKSSLLSQYKISDYINIDPDDIRSLLTENGMNFESEDPKVMAGITNQFNSRMMLYATANRFNIVFDTTGRNMHAMKEALTLTEGYLKVFTAVFTTWENCEARIIARNAKNVGKRKELPLEIAREIYDGFLKGTLSNYLVKYPIQRKVDIIKLFDNNVPMGTEAKLVYESNMGNVVYSENFKGFYDLNILDGNIVPNAKGGRKSRKKRRKGKRKTKRSTGKKRKRKRKTRKRKLSKS
jgi:predicted kinase